jgi:NAD dependent epimerase/dehydratase family enzyme
VSWIGLDDLLDVFGRALADDEMVGPLNAVAPSAVTNGEYASTLARVMRRPARLRVPSFGPGVLLGTEGAREMVQASQRVAPARLAATGHVFRHTSLETCLRHQLGHIDVAPYREESGNA